MLLNDIFTKDVQRPIEGVIKADDSSQLGTEVEEYVVTNEVAKGLEILLEEYTNYTNANGVCLPQLAGRTERRAAEDRARSAESG